MGNRGTRVANTLTKKPSAVHEEEAVYVNDEGETAEEDIMKKPAAPTEEEGKPDLLRDRMKARKISEVFESLPTNRCRLLERAWNHACHFGRGGLFTSCGGLLIVRGF